MVQNAAAQKKPLSLQFPLCCKNPYQTQDYGLYYFMNMIYCAGLQQYLAGNWSGEYSV